MIYGIEYNLLILINQVSVSWHTYFHILSNENWFICEQIKIEIEKFKDQGIDLEQQRQLILRQLEEKQNVASQEADDYEQKYKEVAKILHQLNAGKSH